MPNIMMFGFDGTGYRAAKAIIDKVMADLNLQDKAVTTWSQGSLVTSCDGKNRPMPYIRICGTNKEEINAILGHLADAEIGVDCELLPIEYFFPSAHMHSHAYQAAVSMGLDAIPAEWQTVLDTGKFQIVSNDNPCGGSNWAWHSLKHDTLCGCVCHTDPRET